ncbi:MFS transporter [Sphingomonas psychrotolerans]|uniref:MFS transporter n=1 Tax=Sphingomonas psychrotolerans TaxID=1327635 RepID=A0ABU3N4U6_9SPHN|nr:MFS transporter [Sphingomonas psychrotolerans]MDT8759555.1 MFS transporter [Sphingomonas psychrotolerans]
MPLTPQTSVSEEERGKALRQVVTEGAFASAATALTSGVILTALALHLGASNLVIGVLASAPFLGQLLQAPTILLVEHFRMRKAISVFSSLVGRAMLALMALAPFLPTNLAIAALVFAQLILCGMAAVGGCAWNAWMRDLAPEDRLGWVFSRRSAYAAAVSLVAGIAAAIVLDRTAEGSDWRSLVFGVLYGLGFLAGLISAWQTARIPEPAMPPRPERQLGLLALLREPLADMNFRRLTVFLASWQFAINLATPFFTVFIVRQLGYDMTFVMVLSVVSQMSNLIALRNWGTLADRFANKSVLLVAAPTYILCIVGMIGASQIAHGPWLIGYLVVLHLFMGSAVAGATLATTSIALKLSPKGQSTAYVATAGLATAVAAGLAPILGGAFADFFAAREFQILLRWTSPEGVALVSPLRLSQWDFYFLISGVIGLYAIHRLTLVTESGEIKRSEMLEQVLNQTRRTVRNVSTVAGLRTLTFIPASLLREAEVRARFLRRQRLQAKQN